MHKLYGLKYKFGMYLKESICLLNIEGDRKVIMYISKKKQGEVDISDMEEMFVQDMLSCNIDKLERSYESYIDYFPSYHWELDLQYDDKRVISSATDITPPILEKWIKILVDKYKLPIC